MAAGLNYPEPTDPSSEDDIFHTIDWMPEAYATGAQETEHPNPPFVLPVDVPGPEEEDIDDYDDDDDDDNDDDDDDDDDGISLLEDDTLEDAADSSRPGLSDLLNFREFPTPYQSIYAAASSPRNTRSPPGLGRAGRGRVMYRWSDRHTNASGSRSARLPDGVNRRGLLPAGEFVLTDDSQPQQSPHATLESSLASTNAGSSQGLNRVSRQADTQTTNAIARSTDSSHRHSLRSRSQPAQPRVFNVQTSSGEPFTFSSDIHDSEPSEDDEVMAKDTVVRYRKRRRAGESSRVTSSAETIQLEEYLMSNLRHSPMRANSTNAGSRLNPDAPTFVPGHAPRLLEAFTNLDRSTLPRVYADMLMELSARGQIGDMLTLPTSASYLPPRLPLGSKSLVFTSEVLPRTFGGKKRSALLHIFRTKAQYVPSCVSLATGLPYGIQYHVQNPTRTKDPRPPRLPFGLGGKGWPMDSLPLEVFHIIASHLPRDSLQNMRLVNRDFERKTSDCIFHTVVVAFRQEIYGMMIQNTTPAKRKAVDVKGKGKESLGKPNPIVHDGMRTFQNWGPHIKKFAMAFEVEEGTLEKPPNKGKFEVHPTFWGDYRWPHPHYSRYAFCEDLEKKADEFRCMSMALSNLTEVRELAFSIDSGLGWLSGPDMSDRAQLFKEKPRIFGKRQRILDVAAQEREHIWKGIVKSANPSQARPSNPNAHGFYEATVEWQPGLSSQLSVRTTFDETPTSITNRSLSDRPLIFSGVDIQQLPVRVPIEPSIKSSLPGMFSSTLLQPNALSPSQQEWLLETEWAQRAFLSSFCMALSDNSTTFQHVRSLNIARISSRYLPSLQRADVWTALGQLESLTIQVSADWRNILKSDTGVVEAPTIKPSSAAGQFYTLLQHNIAGLRNIKALSIGYVGGGEDQTGVFGRNKFVLPAPLATFPDGTLLNSVTSNQKTLLALPHVQHLTLINCWLTPYVAKLFTQRICSASMKTITFKSVSLTSHPSEPPLFEVLAGDLGSSVLAQGPPRYGDPTVGNFFELRPHNTPDPSPTGWAVTPQRVGSWGNLIDSITPGADLNFARYAYRYHDRACHDKLKKPVPKNLERITFESCGYVCLTNFKEFQQHAVGPVSDSVPDYLAQRAQELAFVMMHSSADKLLGQIVPSFSEVEKDVLTTGFPMVFGWADQAKAAESLEDGQPISGSGRFSGRVERLTLAPLD